MRDDVDAVILCHAHADARRAGARVPRGGQARAGRDPARRPPGRTPRRWTAAQRRDRPGRDGRAHAALQSQPPVGAPADRGGRVPRAADGRADVLLPPQEHERARASRARGPTTCCGTTRRTRSTSSRGRPGRDRGRERDAGADPSGARHRDGHVDPAQVGHAARSARCRCRSTTTGRSARSSATSATPAPTSPATTTSWTARNRRSTCRKSTCR